MKSGMHLLVLCLMAAVICFVRAGIVDVPLPRRALIERGDDDDCGKGAFGGKVSSTHIPLPNLIQVLTRGKLVMTIAPTPAVQPTVTITKSGKPLSAVTVTITEDIYFDCDQYGDCTPTLTQFSGPTASAKISSKKSGSSKKGRKTATTKAERKKAVAMSTPC